MVPSKRERMQVSQQDFTRVWKQRDMDAIQDIYSLDFRGHGFPGNRTVTRSQYRRTVELFQRMFPDCQIELEEMHADSEFVYASWVFRGTPMIPGFGSSGSPVSFRGTGRHRHRGGKVVEVWIETNWLSVARQVGKTYSRSLTRRFRNFRGPLTALSERMSRPASPSASPR